MAEGDRRAVCGGGGGAGGALSRPTRRRWWWRRTCRRPSRSVWRASAPPGRAAEPRPAPTRRRLRPRPRSRSRRDRRYCCPSGTPAEERYTSLIIQLFDVR